MDLTLFQHPRGPRRARQAQPTHPHAYLQAGHVLVSVPSTRSYHRIGHSGDIPSLPMAKASTVGSPAASASLAATLLNELPLKPLLLMVVPECIMRHPASATDNISRQDECINETEGIMADGPVIRVVDRTDLRPNPLGERDRDLPLPRYLPLSRERERERDRLRRGERERERRDERRLLRSGERERERLRGSAWNFEVMPRGSLLSAASRRW